MTISPSQAKAARELLGWSKRQLADRAGISSSTVWIFEASVRPLGKWCILVIQRALEDAGVEFIDDESVRMRGPSMTSYATQGAIRCP